MAATCITAPIASFLRERGASRRFDPSWGTDPVQASVPDDYMAKRYHTPKDEWTPDIDFRGAAQNNELLYWIGHNRSNSRKWPEWLPGTEFKALRDKSAAARKL